MNFWNLIGLPSKKEILNTNEKVLQVKALLNENNKLVNEINTNYQELRKEVVNKAHNL